jgi:hypothetical protein
VEISLPITINNKESLTVGLLQGFKASSYRRLSGGLLQFRHVLIKGKKKGKTIPVTDRGGP